MHRVLPVELVSIWCLWVMMPSRTVCYAARASTQQQLVPLPQPRVWIVKLADSRRILAMQQDQTARYVVLASTRRKKGRHMQAPA